MPVLLTPPPVTGVDLPNLSAGGDNDRRLGHKHEESSCPGRGSVDSPLPVAGRRRGMPGSCDSRGPVQPALPRGRDDKDSQLLGHHKQQELLLPLSRDLLHSQLRYSGREEHKQLQRRLFRSLPSPQPAFDLGGQSAPLCAELPGRVRPCFLVSGRRKRTVTP